MAPVLCAILPLALSVGLVVARSPVPNAVGWLGAPVIFAGSAHLAVIALLGAGASPLVAAGTALAVNARLVVYGASLSALFEAQPRWFRLLAPHFLVDQTYALVMGREERSDPAWLRAYYLACAAALTSVWLPGVALGIVAEPVFPEGWQVGLAGPLVVASLLGTSLRSWTAAAVGAVGFGAGVVLVPFTGGLTVVVASIAAMAVSRLGWPRPGARGGA